MNTNGQPVTKLFGWLDLPWAVNNVLKGMPVPVLAESPEGRRIVDTAEPKDVAFWQLETTLLGAPQPAHKQTRGTCVGQGFSRAVEFLVLAEIAAGEREEWWAKVAPASIYGPSRVEIGGGVNGDGSTGAWAAKSLKQMGVLLRMLYTVGSTTYDLRSNDDDHLCVSWGSSGMPNPIEPEARLHLVSDASLLTTTEMALACAWSYFPFAFCSNQGFTTVRDQYGMCHPSGSWPHCMAGGGALKIKHPSYPSGRWTFPFHQSWGQDNPSGPNKTVLHDSGLEITLPNGTFLVDAEVVGDRVLPARDSWAVAGMNGWMPILEDFYLLPR